jgi:hypothetical protein
MVLSYEDDLPRAVGKLTTTMKSRKEVPVFARVKRSRETQVTLKKVTAVPIRSGSSERWSKSREVSALSSQASTAPPSARRGRKFDPLLPSDPSNLTSAKLKRHSLPQIPPISRRGAQAPPHRSAEISGFERMRRYEGGAISGGGVTVQAWVAVIRRLQMDFPEEFRAGESRRDTLPVCSYKSQTREGARVTSDMVVRLMRFACTMHDGGNRYGFTEGEIGTRSIRSCAAMALAVQGGQSDPKIMMLGRWKSRRFMEYIQPQVLEWAGSMLSDMAKVQPYLDLGNYSPTPKPSPMAKSCLHEESDASWL